VSLRLLGSRVWSAKHAAWRNGNSSKFVASVAGAVFQGRRALPSGQVASPKLLRTRHGALTVAFGLCAAGTLVFALQAASAGASPSPSALSVEAGSIDAKIVSTANQLDVLATQTTEADARLESADNALVADENELAQVKTRLSDARAALRKIALSEYMQAGNIAMIGGPWSSPAKAASSQAYEQIASDNQSTAIDSFVKDENIVANEEVQVRTTRAYAEDTYTTLEHEHAVLESRIADEQSMLNTVKQQEAESVPSASQGEGAPVAVTFIQVAKSPPAPSQATGAQSTTTSSSLVSPPSSLPPSTSSSASSSLQEDLARLRQCESGDNYQANTGNGYYGAYQFSLATWNGLGYSGLPSAAPPPTQDQAAITLEETSGWGQWPVCAAILGLT